MDTNVQQGKDLHVVLIDFYFFEYTISLANALATQVQISLLMPTEFKPLAGMLSPEIKLVYFTKPRLRSPANLRMLVHIRELLENLRPDVTHLLSVNPWLNLAFTIWHPVPLVTTIHDPVMHAGDRSQRKIPQGVRDLPISRSQHLIVHGQSVKDTLLARHTLSPDHITVVPIGELSLYKQWSEQSWPEQEGTILFFGRIWPYKGLDYLIAAEPAITAACPQARFVIAGQGEDFDRYRAMMKHPEYFEVLNEYIPREDVPRLFQQASVVVLPYIEASQSAVIPLAYAFGKPVVATAVGGIPDVLEDGVTGYLVPPRDVHGLANAVVRLLQDREGRRRMGQKALEKTRNEMSWDTVAQQTVEVYQMVIHQANAR
ncbi:MAG: glycosyltransferase family 4 protein [Anaerolineae bacterium]|nr:glycosyltransferase family 4 protein [Anaerolineae bacterium]